MAITITILGVTQNPAIPEFSIPATQTAAITVANSSVGNPTVYDYAVAGIPEGLDRTGIQAYLDADAESIWRQASTAQVSPEQSQSMRIRADLANYDFNAKIDENTLAQSGYATAAQAATTVNQLGRVVRDMAQHNQRVLNDLLQNQKKICKLLNMNEQD